MKTIRALIGAGVVLATLGSSTMALSGTDYIVQPGDTPCEIAELFGVRCVDLMARNSLEDDNVIYPGQILKITDAPSTKAASEDQAVAADNEPEPEAPAVAVQTTSASVSISEQSAGANGVDLLAVYRLAWSSDQVFAAEAYKREAGLEVVPVAQAALRPQLSASSSYTLSSKDLTNQAASATLALKQSLYNRSSRLALKQARYRADAADAEYAMAAESLIQRVATSYFAVLSAQDNLELSDRNQRAIQRQLELAEERLNVGLGTRTDLHEARARFEIAVAEGIEARLVLDDTRQALIALVGDDPGQLLALSPDAALSAPEPDDVELWVSRALADNRSLKVLQLDVAVAEAEIDRQRALRRLTVGLNLSAGYDDSATADSASTSLTLSFKLPFYQGGLIDARMREAALSHNATRARFESSRRNVQRKTRQAFLSINSQMRRISALAEAVRAGESALQAKEEGFAAGLTTNIEVLDAQRDLFSAERDYLKARYEYVLQVLLLEQLAGQLDDQDVSRVNRWLGVRTW